MGTGLFRYRVFIKGYVAALYLADSISEGVTPSIVLADAPRRLEIEYFWAIPGNVIPMCRKSWGKSRIESAVRRGLPWSHSRMNHQPIAA